MAEGTPVDYPRGERGRFGPGNPGGPGGSRKRAELKRAAENALTPQLIDAMMRKAARMSLEGNMPAMRLVLDRTTGRPSPAAPEPEELDIRLPELTTMENCGSAMDVVVAGMTNGKVHSDMAKTLLDFIRTKMVMLRQLQQERAHSDAPAPARQICNKVLRLLFLRFKKTGELPLDVDEAAAVCLKLIDGYDVIESDPSSSTLTIESLQGFVLKPRPDAKDVDSLLHEAVYGVGLIQEAARHFLRVFASVGADLTKDFLANIPIPRFGPVGMHLLGFPMRFAEGRRKAQGKRLLKRIDADRARLPTTQALAEERFHRVSDAVTCFVIAGERPDDAEILDSMLICLEMDAFLDDYARKGSSDLLRVLDTAGNKTGAAREAAIAKLQTMAKAGVLLGLKEAR